MTPEQKETVRVTFSLLDDKRELLSDMLYKKLFELEPKSQALFRGDMIEQRRKLMRMLQVAVENIDNPEQLHPMLFNLGQIHHSFGIEREQFSSFGKALKFALKTTLGQGFTPAVDDAWQSFYLYLATMMNNLPRKMDVQLPHH